MDDDGGELAGAALAAVTYGGPREVDPATALLEEVHRTAGHVAWLGALVASLSPDELTQRARGPGGETWERPAVWVEMYRQERAHLAMVCRVTIAAGVEERFVRMLEAQAEAVAGAVAAVIDDPEVGLDPARRLVARRVAARHLRALDAPPHVRDDGGDL